MAPNEEKLQKIEEEFKVLDYLYHQRNLNNHTLDKALYLIRQFYERYQSHSFSDLPANELRALSVTCEALDYFNRLDVFMGCDFGYDEHAIYDWLIERSSDLHSSIPVKAERLQPAQDPLLLLYQTRLVAAVFLNEKYRNNKYEYIHGSDSELGELISFAERCLRPRMESDFQSLAAYGDVMANLTFLYGKAARQSGQYFEAERSFYKSSSCMLNLALSYSSAQETGSQDKAERDKRIDDIRSKVRRIGVVDLARAWLYLAWGKIEKANLYAERAIQLLGPADTLSNILAKSIQGIALRIKSGHDRQKLKEAIGLLQSSYKSFFSDIKVPRHSIRTLYELEIALILNNDLEDAFKNIDQVVKKVNREQVSDYSREGIYRRDFKKLVQDSRWQCQMHILCSRIARKDKHSLLKDSLRMLLNDLSRIRKIRNQQSPEVEPRTFRSQDLAVKFAETARDIAVQNKLRIYEMDSLIALGEAWFNLGKYNKARAIFTDCLGLVKSPHGQSSDKGIDGSDFCALSHLHLARIAVRNHEQEPAKLAYHNYKQLPLVEHSWILEFAAIVKKEMDELLEGKIVVPFNQRIAWQDLKKALEREAIKKMIIEPLEKGEKPHKIMERLGISKTAFYELKKYYKDGQSPLPGDKDGQEDEDKQGEDGQGGDLLIDKGQL